MERSPEELRKTIKHVLDYPLLMRIVADAENPTAAEKKALDEEFPLTLVKEVRDLALIKKKDRAIYDDIRKVITPSMITGYDHKRIFPCCWNRLGRHGDNFENIGEVHFTPHLFLPPLFGDFQVYNDSGELLFTSDNNGYDEIRAPQKNEEPISVIFTAGSKSVPVGLVMQCHLRNISYRVGSWAYRQMKFRPKIHSRRAELIRKIPFCSHNKAGEALVESFEYVPERHLGDNADYTRVILRNLTPDEYRAGVFWPRYPNVLFHNRIIHCPIGTEAGQGLLSLTITTHYDVPGLSEGELDQNNICQKWKDVDIAEYGDHSLYRSSQVSISLNIRRSCDPVKAPSIPLHKKIKGIIDGTPDRIDGIRTLWNYFGFKDSSRPGEKKLVPSEK